MFRSLAKRKWLRSSVSHRLRCRQTRTPWTPLHSLSRYTKTTQMQFSSDSDSSEPKAKSSADGSYLEEEYFGGKSPLNVQGLTEPKLPDTSKKEEMTALAKEISQTINARGPMTFANFWEICMQDPRHGYYMTRDPIGREGDFITTPEMFSGFGECLAVWCIYTWEQMGKPEKIKIIEFGPGLGTVTKAILEVARKEQLAPFRAALQIHLIESSSRLRWKQKNALKIANVRKFKMKVKKPMYAAALGSQNRSSGQKVSTQETTSVSAAKEDFENANLFGTSQTDVIPPEELSAERSAAALKLKKEAESESKKEKKKKKKSGKKDVVERSKESPILRPGESPSTKQRPGAFDVDKMFGDFSQTAQSVLGTAGGSASLSSLDQSVKDKIPPFDWSLLNPGIFKETEEGDAEWITGEKTRKWEEKHEGIKSAVADAEAVFDGEKAKPDSKRERERKARKRSEAMGGQSAADDRFEGLSGSGVSNPELDRVLNAGGGDGDEKVDFGSLLNFEDLEAQSVEEEEDVWQSRTKDGVVISWHDSLQSVETGAALFIAHEFFDALPIQHFEYRPMGWVETLVDCDSKDNSPLHFEFTRGNSTSFAATVLDRQFAAKGLRPTVGQQLSLCAAGNEVASEMAKWVSAHGGAGFIVDYGDSSPPPWTVQGAAKHKPTHVLSAPGQTDISAHVHFGHLQQAMEQVKGVKVHGPVTQCYFLQGCGIVHRFRHYLENDLSESQKDAFIETFAKIMDVNKLGAHFKVLGFCKDTLGTLLGFRQPVSEKKAKVDEFGVPVYKKTKVPL